MPTTPTSRRGFVAGIAATIVATPALAHHGWAWTEDEPFQLTGSIDQIYIGHPHVTLRVSAEDGMWDVDMAPLARSLRAGFNETVAKVGDAVTCVGFRARDHNERHMKAARVIVNGNTYDVYPDRVPNI